MEESGMVASPMETPVSDAPDPPVLSVSGVAEGSSEVPAPLPQGLVDARERAAAGNLAGAIEAYRGFIVSTTRAAQARLELARLYEAKNEWQLALEQYEAAREEEDGLDATLGVAAALAAIGKFEAADRELRRAARSHPSSAQVFATSGTIAFRRGRYTEAEQDLKRAIDLDPENGYAYFYRGEALNQLSRVDEALEMLERATQLLPALSRAYYVMGILFDKKGRPQEAAAMYRRAREVAAA
ncbi:MAG: tetratricopeptide repeat protein [Longimicrobiales bacterium]